jgi:hypothetical protein
MFEFLQLQNTLMSEAKLACIETRTHAVLVMLQDRTLKLPVPIWLHCWEHGNLYCRYRNGLQISKKISANFSIASGQDALSYNVFTSSNISLMTRCRVRNLQQCTSLPLSVKVHYNIGVEAYWSFLFPVRFTLV